MRGIIFGLFVYVGIALSQPHGINIGGIFDSADVSLEAAFEAAIFNGTYFSTPTSKIKTIQPFNSFQASEAVCQLMEHGVLAIFGPQSSNSWALVQSVCSQFGIPHFNTRWNYHGEYGKGNFINVFPHEPTLAKAYGDLVKLWNWKSFAIIYQNDSDLIRIREVFKSDGRIPNDIMVVQLSTDGDYHKSLKRINNADPTRPDVQKFAELLKQNRTEKTDNLLELIDSSQLKTESALLIDALNILMKALKEIGWYSFNVKPLYCESHDIWKSGSSLYDYINLMLPQDGLSGKMKLNKGYRKEFDLDIMEIQGTKMEKIGVLSSISESTKVIGLHINATKPDTSITTGIIRNKHLRIVTILSSPYVMLRTSDQNLTGNHRYTGFCVELLERLAVHLGFTYTLYEASDGTYGRFNEETKTWSGIIGEVQNHNADLAVGDITISSQRQEYIEFSTTFMHLGIGLLYQKPQRTSSDFLYFLWPFSTFVWVLTGLMLIVVSATFYVVGRVSPYEWNNRCHCNHNSDELHNHFSFLNCLWYTFGYLMQQGSNISIKAYSTRTLATCWWFFTVIMVASYTANLFSMFLIRDLEVPIKDIYHLEAQHNIKYGCLGSGSTRAFFKNHEFAIFQRMFYAMENAYPSVYTKSNMEGLDRVRQGNYAFFMESPSLEYIMERYCDLTQIGNLLNSKGYAIAMAKNSHYRDIFSAAILHLQERGDLLELRTKWWRHKNDGGQCGEQKNPPAIPITLSSIKGILIALVAVLVLAIAVSVLEFWWKLRQVSRYQRKPFCSAILDEIIMVFKCKDTKDVVSLLNEEEEEPISIHSINSDIIEYSKTFVFQQHRRKQFQLCLKHCICFVKIVIARIMDENSNFCVPEIIEPDVDDDDYQQYMEHQLDSTEDGDAFESKQVIVGICAMEKKSRSKPMREILMRLQEFEYIRTVIFPEEVILKEPVENWPSCDCLISFHSKGFPLDKAVAYVNKFQPFIINDLHMQYDLQDRRKVYAILQQEGIDLPRFAILDRDSKDPQAQELVEGDDHVEVNGEVFNKPFVEKPVSAEDHNIYIYYPTSAGGGSQRLFRKIGSRSSVYSPESRIRKTGSYIYEDFMPTDGTDVKVYTVGLDYAHAEARKSPALDGKVERDSEGKEVRYPVILSNIEKLIARKVCLAFKQTVCGFDLLRANGKSYVCDVNGFSFVKNSMKYYDDCSKILGNMILRELAPQLHIPWSIPFQLDDPPIVPTTFGKMMELRCVVAVIRHGDRTPKQKMKMEVKHQKFFEIFEKYEGFKDGHVKLKKPKQLQEILDIARFLLSEIDQKPDPEIEEKKSKLEQLKSVLEMYGHFSGINRKVQLKYQPKGRPRRSSSDDDVPREPSLVLILKWGGELTASGRVQAEELGRVFRCMYPGGQGLGLLRLHSTYRHDLKIYASDEGRVQMTAAAFAKGLLALEGELTPILVQMVKSANTNGLLDNDHDSSKFQNMVKARLHELMQQDRDFTAEDRQALNPTNATSIRNALNFIKNPVKACQHIHGLVDNLMELIKTKRDDKKTRDVILYHGETWDLMQRRWGKLEKDFQLKSDQFDISKVPDIFDCIKYDLQHNQHKLQYDSAIELYMYAKALADIVVPQEYGLTSQEKLTIAQGICTPLLKKIRADLQRNIEHEDETEAVNRLNPIYSHGVSSPGRHVRTRLYFTSESHIHSLLTVLRYGGLVNVSEQSAEEDEQWRRAMEYISAVSELNYMTQVVIMLYEDPTKDPSSEERFHVELHFSPGVVCCVQRTLPPGPGFRPQSRNEPKEKRDSFDSTVSSEGGGATSAPLSSPLTPVDCKTGRIDEELEDSFSSIKNGNLSTSSSNNEKLLSEVTTPEKQTSGNFFLPVVPISNVLNVNSCSSDQLAEAPLTIQRKRAISMKTSEPISIGQVYWNNDHSSKERPKYTIRRHRHSVPGQTFSYLNIHLATEFNHGKALLLFGASSSLFSTAVISGSSSAPELNIIELPNSSSIGGLQSCGGVTPIGPLETLHNALSLHQLDLFLEKMTNVVYRTPFSSPPKMPSTPTQGSCSWWNFPLLNTGSGQCISSSFANASENDFMTRMRLLSESLEANTDYLFK
ncbi:hypothetical protein CHUAL_003923 [Chamberlinius hualienensis]